MSKPHQLCAAVGKYVLITVQCGANTVCKIPAASQKWAYAELVLALRGEETAGGNAGSWLLQGEELSVCIDITALLRSNSIDL